MLHRVYTAPRAILAQFGVTLVLASALLPSGPVPAYSALIGGLVAASAVADSYLASRGYALPLSAWGSDLTAAVCRIAAWSILVNHRGVNPDDPAHAAVRLGQQDAMAWLRDVARGTANADVQTTSPARKTHQLAGVFVGADSTGTRGW